MARMELPVLDKFCFIFDLRAGCMAMGVINSILAFILAIMLITFASEMKELSEAQKSRDDSDANMSSVVYTIVVLLVVLLFVKCLSDLVVVYGVYKEKVSFIKKYSIFWMIFLVLFIVGFLKALFHLDAGYVIAQILFMGENLYYMMVIRSYLISINEDGVL
ncbi:uncharacterized protein LOC142977142 [Anticarsia gemmatalis]|uniref:uncharacterized protein LOC142977142 n=1 Tax=Anticarsia gemmatalis TaxID=129554 RepID=UPI003F75F006